MRHFVKGLAVMAALLMAPLAFGFLVLQLNLAQLTALADRVFVGRCIELQQAKDQNGRLVQYVTYEVTQTLKGKPEATISFKQLVMEASPLPTYEEGEEAVIFLSDPSDIGLTAPVGFTQGKFRVEADENGQKRVVNGIGNQGLFAGMKKSPHYQSKAFSQTERQLIRKSSKVIRYDEFISMVQKLAQ